MIGMCRDVYKRQERIKLRNILCKLIVDLGLDGLLDFMDLALKDSGLSSKFLRMILLGEGDVNVLLIPGFQADQLIFKPGDELTGTDNEGVILRLAALKRNAVDRAVKVKYRGVARLDLALNGRNGRVALRHALNFTLHVLVGNNRLDILGRKALVCPKRHFRFNRYLGDKDKAVLIDGRNVDIAGADRLGAGLFERRFIRFRIAYINRFLVEKALAVHLFDDLARRLALAEARNIDFRDVLVIRLFARCVKRRLVDCDLKRYDALFFFFHLVQFHISISS